MGTTELLMVIAVLGGIIAVLYPTFRGAAADAPRRGPDARTAVNAEPSTEWAELEDRRRKLLQALAELGADLEAGNIGERDYRRMRRRYEVEAVRILEAMEDAPPPTAGPPSRARTTAESGAAEARDGEEDRSRGRWPAALGWGAAALAFIALAGVALSGALGPRGPDDVMTGGLPGSERPEDAAGGALMPVDDQRMAELERRVAADSSDVAALVELGHLYLAVQRFDPVARLSMKALALDEENAEALTHLGMVLVAADHVPEAQQAFARALEMQPDFHEALLYRGIVAFQTRDFELAVSSWERYLEVAPPDANVTRVRAMLEGARQAAAAADS